MKKARSAKKTVRDAKASVAAAAEPAFAAVSRRFSERPGVTQGVMFGSAGLKVEGKVFAMLVKGALVVKLPKARVDALVASGSAGLFDPGHGKPMKEWASVHKGKTPWVDLAGEAYEFVKGGAK